jgi:channel protein (hemolysin III family)
MVLIGTALDCCMDHIDVFPIPGFREPVSCLTHLLAVPVYAILGYYLVRRGRGNWGRTVSLATMAFSSVFLLSMSAVYHLLGPGVGRYVMARLDVAGVFALIAGTVTPVHAILFSGFHRWAPLLLVWSAAATGITLRTVFSESLAPGVGTAIFLLMGWGGIDLLHPIMEALRVFVRRAVAVGRCGLHAGSDRPGPEWTGVDPWRRRCARVVAPGGTRWTGPTLEICIRIR